MDPRSRLADNLVRESAAYGYTLTVWGSGAMLIAAFGMPPPDEVFAFVSGAVVGFAALAALAFQGVLEERDTDCGDLRVASMVHVVATLGTLAVVYGFTHLRDWLLPDLAAFAAVGVFVVVGYNLALLVEELLAHHLTHGR
jgi:hypothetical protein